MDISINSMDSMFALKKIELKIENFEKNEKEKYI